MLKHDYGDYWSATLRARVARQEKAVYFLSVIAIFIAIRASRGFRGRCCSALFSSVNHEQTIVRATAVTLVLRDGLRRLCLSFRTCLAATPVGRPGRPRREQHAGLAMKMRWLNALPA
jgi:hypothetical protein